jgi:hypothetical protein
MSAPREELARAQDWTFPNGTGFPDNGDENRRKDFGLQHLSFQTSPASTEFPEPIYITYLMLVSRENSLFSPTGSSLRSQSFSSSNAAPRLTDERLTQGFPCTRGRRKHARR